MTSTDRPHPRATPTSNRVTNCVNYLPLKGEVDGRGYVFEAARAVAICAQFLVGTKLSLMLVLSGNFIGHKDHFFCGAVNSGVFVDPFQQVTESNRVRCVRIGVASKETTRL